jgi:hypothetical protein
MRLGMSFCEALSGSFWWLDAPTDERAIAVSFEARAPALREFLRDKTWCVAGTIDAERFATARAIVGTVSSRLIEERRLPYRFTFSGDDGRRYELSGQKEWSGLAPVESLALLPAGIYDDRGEELARATLRFDVGADWWKCIRSFRFRLAVASRA